MSDRKLYLKDDDGEDIVVIAPSGRTLESHMNGAKTAERIGLAPKVVPPPVDPPPVDPPPVDPPPTGSHIPTADPAGWKRIVSEDFDTASASWPGPYAANFSAYPKGWSDTAKSQGKRGGQYDPAIASVHDGMLDLFIHTSGGTHWVCAPTIVPGGTSNYKSARVEIRFKADALHGYKTAWLFWPGSNTWPRDGEIDFPERNLDSSKVDAFMHKQGATSGGDQYNANTAFDLTQWHTTAIEWKAGVSCEFFLDGKSIGKTTDRVPNTPMHFVIQTETALDGTDPADTTQGHVLIDYVCFWVPA